MEKTFNVGVQLSDTKLKSKIFHSGVFFILGDSLLGDFPTNPFLGDEPPTSTASVVNLLSLARLFTSCSASITARAVHSRPRFLSAAVRSLSLCSAGNPSARSAATSSASAPTPRLLLRCCRRRRWSCSHSTWSGFGKEKLINIEHRNSNDIGSVWTARNFQRLRNH